MKSYDKAYSKPGLLWGEKPNKIIVQAVKFGEGTSRGNALDIGVGEGRNAIYLAQQGFKVTGIDSSQKGIEKFLDRARSLSLKVQGIIEDMRDFKFAENYNLIISTAALNFLKREQAISLIRKMQENTNPNGINAISAFNEEDPNKKFSYLFRKGELKELYSSWEVLYESEYKTPPEQHGDSPIHTHGISEIIARKLN